jgi:hypothetical protein
MTRALVLPVLLAAGCQAIPAPFPQAPPTGSGLDGAYRVSRLLCAGQEPEDFRAGTLTWTLAGGRGRSELTLPGGCVVRTEAEVSYPAEGWIQFRRTGFQCSAQGCGAELCGESAAEAAPMLFPYWVDGSTVTLAHVSDGSADEPCADGESVVIEVTRLE